MLQKYYISAPSLAKPGKMCYDRKNSSNPGGSIRIMKNAIRILTAVAAALLMATAASAASAASPEPDKLAKPIPVVADGMAPLIVTSSVADFCPDTSVLFDGKADTSVEVSIDEESVDSVFTLKTATGLPEALSAVALITESRTNAELRVRIWGTNDSLEKEWTPLSFSLPVVKTGDWRILNLTEPEGGWKNAVKYAFYKIEFSFDVGTSFDFAECLLIRPELGEPRLSYGSAEVVEEGQTPPVISSPAEPAAEAEPEARTLPRRLTRGLFWPGYTK